MLMNGLKLLQQKIRIAVAGVHKAVICENWGKAIDSRSEAAQESVVGNASSKRKSSGPDRSKKLVLQLTPLNDELRSRMMSHGLNPGLELICRS